MKKVITCLFVVVILILNCFATPTLTYADTAYNSNNAVGWSQWGQSWSSYYYNGTISVSGCGILSSVNAINYLNGYFDTYAKAGAGVDEIATYAHSIGGYNPTYDTGTYRYILFGTDISNPPPLQTKFGSKYEFTMPITWTENWNSANYDPYWGGYFNNIYISGQTSLKNYLAGDAVAIAHVPNHFICLADYNPANDHWLVLDSAPYYTRGGLSVGWYSSAQLSGGIPALTVGGYCVLQTTKESVKYPYQIDSNTMMLYDGESISPVETHYDTTKSQTPGENGQTGGLYLKMTNPTGHINNVGGMAKIHLSSAANLSDYKKIYFSFYTDRTLTGSHGIQLNFLTDSTKEDGFNCLVAVNGAAEGWNRYAIDITQHTTPALAGTSWSSIKAIRITWFNYAKLTGNQVFVFDNIKATKDGSTGGTSSGGSQTTKSYPYQIDANNLMIHDGEVTRNITTAFSTSLSTTPGENGNTGGICLKMNTPTAHSGNIGGMAKLVLDKAADLSDYDIIEVPYYSNRSFNGSSGGLQINFITNSSHEDGFNYMIVLNDVKEGWNKAELGIRNKPNPDANNASWSNINAIRITWFNYAGFSDPQIFVFDNIKAVKEVTVSYPYAINGNSEMLYDGETSRNITTAYSTSFSLADSVDGSKGLKMVCNAPAQNANGNKVGGMALFNFNTPGDFSAYDTITFDLYLSRSFENNHGSFQMNFVSSTTKEDGFNISKALNRLKQGWNNITINLADHQTPVVSDASWNNINRLRFTWFNNDGSTDNTYFIIDNIRANKETEPESSVVTPPDESSVVILPPVNMIYGDLDFDGNITSVDALMVLQYSVDRLEFTEDQIWLADVTAPFEGNVNSLDALQILQYSVNKIFEFDIEII